MAKLNLQSDNAGPAHPALIDAAARAAAETHAAYGGDAWSERAGEAVARTFGDATRMILTPTGTAANTLALAAACPPWGAVFLHEDAHILRDEGTAPSFATAGGRLAPLAGAHGKIAPETLAAALENWPNHVHAAKPAVLSITNLSESGTAYRPDEIAGLSRIAKDAGLAVHMDGARFANACAFLGADAAALTRDVGVDLLSLGATKNGAPGCEALIIFETAPAADYERLRKRGGHLLSRFAPMAAQLVRWLEDDLWLDLAGRANAAAARFAQGLGGLGLAPEHPVEGNEVFVRLDGAARDRARDRGLAFHDWPDGTARFVFDWSKTLEDADLALSLLDEAAARRPAAGAA